MSPRRKRTLGIAACLAAAALAATMVVRLITRNLEPHYEGRALSFWMAQLAKDRVDEAELKQATNAIAKIGVPALPYLVNWLQFEPPRWKAALADRTSGYSLPFVNNQGYYIWVTDRRPKQLAGATFFGFQALGKRAMPAFNELCQILFNSKDSLVACRAVGALTCLGTNALSPLLEAAANLQHPAALEALNSLGAIPEVVEAAQAEASGAASFLGITNKEPTLVQINDALMRNGFPQVTFPAVAASMVSPNLAARVWPVITPARPGQQDSNVVSALANALTHPDINVRRYATNALQEIAPEALANAPAH